MAVLNYEVLKASGYRGYILPDAPEKVLQFGEGGFLRAFADDFIDIANEKAGFNGKVVLLQPIPQGLSKMINDQEGLYTLYLRGRENGEKKRRKNRRAGSRAAGEHKRSPPRRRCACPGCPGTVARFRASRSG